MEYKFKVRFVSLSRAFKSAKAKLFHHARELSAGDWWHDLLRDGPRELSTAHNDTLRSLPSFLRLYRETMSSDFLQRLPDDLLLHILQEVLSTVRTNNLENVGFDKEQSTGPLLLCNPIDAMRLSRVCKRFYLLIKNSPPFWDVVHNGISSSQFIHMCLERSKRRGLNLRISFGYNFDSFFNIVTPHQDRWRSLWMDMPDHFELIKTHFKNARLPSLERLTVNFGDGPSIGIFSQCLLPSLRVVSFFNCIPRPSATQISSNLTLFFGSFSRSNLDEDFTPFFTFLTSTLSLRNLTVVFDCEDIRRARPFETNAPATVIPQVTDLQITTPTFRLASAMFDAFIDALTFPGLQCLTIKHHNTIRRGEDPSLYFSLRACLRDILISEDADRFPELSKLTVISEANRAYTIPFEYLPKLRHLRIDAITSPIYFSEPGDDIDSASIPDVLPALEMLEFYHCEYFDVRWVEHVVDRLKRSGDQWSKFKRLVVHNCKDATLEKLSFVPKEKLDWKAYVIMSDLDFGITLTEMISLFNSHALGTKKTRYTIHLLSSWIPSPNRRWRGSWRF